MMSGGSLLGAIAAAAAGLVLAGCPDSGGHKGPQKTERVHVRSFTEASPVRAIAAAPPYVFTAAERGLDRWQLPDGDGLHLSAEHGLPGDRVAAMAADPERGWVWIITEGGLTRYDVKSSTFAEVPPAPSVLGLGDLQQATLAAAANGGLWIGDRKGLFYTNQAGQWTATGVTSPVTALVHTADGRLWIGGDQGLYYRQLDGQTFELGSQLGCDLARVRFIVLAPGGEPLIVGENAAGAQRVVLWRDEACATYRASPKERWLAAASRQDDVVILTERRLYSLHAPHGGALRLQRDGMRLYPVPVAGAKGPRSPYHIEPLDLEVPTGALVLATAGDEILVGTRDLGTARLGNGRRRARVRWLRRGELAEGASSLSVACQARDDCYVATGAPHAWRFDGDTFRRFDSGDSRVLAVVRNRKGRIYGFQRGEEDQHLVLAEIKKGVWLHTSEITIETPGGRPEISFARFSPGGVLWVGLRFRDEAGELRPYGVALVDIGLGAVAYHHASADVGEVEKGVLPIPINVVEAAFLGESETWLATTEGAARVRGNKVTVFTEDDGLRSEFLRGIACMSGGVVFVASRQGVGVYDGDRWQYPAPLRRPVNDIEVARDNRLWMATNRGVAVYDGAKVRRVDVRRGLLQNHIDDIVIDDYGRIWARGSMGLTIITP